MTTFYEILDKLNFPKEEIVIPKIDVEIGNYTFDKYVQINKEHNPPYFLFINEKNPNIRLGYSGKK